MRIHKLAKLLPDMTEAEYAALKDDIAAHGLNEEIWLYEGQILDGRHRYLACQETGVAPRSREYKGDHPAAFVLSENAIRRHWNQSQLTMATARMAKSIQSEIEKGAPKGFRKKRTSLSSRKRVPGGTDKHNDGDDGGNGTAAKRSSKKTGASERSTGRAMRLLKDAPDLAERVDRGEMTIGQAERELKRRQKATELKAKAAAAPASAEWRIIWGDCLAELPKLKKVRCIFADPPYNIGIDYGDGAKADSLPEDKYLAWCHEWLTACASAITDDGSLWVMINDRWAEHFAVMLNEAGLHRRAWIKWYETFGVNCENNFNRTSRHIFYYVVNPKRFVFNADAVMRPSDRQTKYNDKRATDGGKILDDVWQVPRMVDNHGERIPGVPTQIPQQITDWIVGCASDPGDLVVDPFAGSGTTGASCKKLNRRFIGVEKNQDYADLATVRIAGTGVAV